VRYTDPRDSLAARLVFVGLDGRCSARFVRAADVSRYAPSQPLGETEHELRVAIAFTSIEAMNAWTPFTGCHDVDANAMRSLLDDWAVAQLGPRMKPRQPEPDRARYCPPEHPEGMRALVLYYDVELVAVAVRTIDAVERLTAPPYLRPAWAK